MKLTIILKNQTQIVVKDFKDIISYDITGYDNGSTESNDIEVFVPQDNHFYHFRGSNTAMINGCDILFLFLLF